MLVNSKHRLRSRLWIAGRSCLAVCFVLLPAMSAAAQQSSANSPGTITGPPTPPEHPLLPAIRIAEQCRERLRRLDDYEAVFTKHEVVGRRIVTQQMYVKLRHQPFSVYIKYLQPHEGREVVFVEGQNSGRLVAHLTGLQRIVGTLHLPPDSPEAMSDNRYPITHMGLETLLDTIIDQWQLESKYDEIDVKYYPRVRLGDVRCKVIESMHPRPRRQFQYHKTRLYIDADSRLPVRVENFAFPQSESAQPQIVEQYTYGRLKTNLGLTDMDFSQRNPEYDF